MPETKIIDEKMESQATNILQEADVVFSKNMERHGYSFSYGGLIRAAYDSDGQLKKNWRLAMRLHQPSQTEYPDLFMPPRFFEMQNRVTSKKRAVDWR